MVSSSNRLSFQCGIVFRLALVLFGIMLDSQPDVELKYTDVDYNVFTDGSRLVFDGKSPYDRSDYRYPPLLAWLLVPNLFTPIFGKLLFCMADSYIIILIGDMLQLMGADKFDVDISLWQWIWALNPFSSNIASRGSSDSLSNMLVLFVLKYTIERREVMAGIGLGLCVYFRIYPVIYGPTILLYILRMMPESSSIDEKKYRLTHLQNNVNAASSSNGYYLEDIINLSWRKGLLFLGVSLIVFSGLVTISYYYYGQTYIDNSLLYHAERSDHRHNFSPHFYLTYLCDSCSQLSASSESSSLDVCKLCPNPDYMTYFIMFPQLCLLIGITISSLRKANTSSSLVKQTFVLTLVFVAFNKVSTAQYFTWYASLLPVCLPMMLKGRLNDNKDKDTGSSPWKQVLALILTLVSWLACAYILEISGQPVFFWVWLNSVLLTSAHVYAITWCLMS